MLGNFDETVSVKDFLHHADTGIGTCAGLDGEAVFEDGVFPISAHYDALLTRLYGDWHVLPPPHERRCKEHAAILDLERPYTEYLEQQRRMEIAQYTRSIR